MSLGLYQQNMFIGDNTAFRLMVTNYRAAMLAAGMVRTSDTGQIDPTTVNRPAGSNTSAGHDIFRFNDAAQATQPLFIKVQYGTGSPVEKLSLWITVGRGTDGAGNITGTLIGQTQVHASSSTPPSATADFWCTAGDGYVTSALNAGPGRTNDANHWVVERLRLPDGSVDTTANGAGIMWTWSGNSSSFGIVSHDGLFADSGDVAYPTLAPAAPSSGSSLYRGSSYAYPVYPVLGFARGASRALLSVHVNDVSSGIPFSVQLYSAAHLFRSNGIGQQARYGRTSFAIPAFRYE